MTSSERPALPSGKHDAAEARCLACATGEERKDRIAELKRHIAALSARLEASDAPTPAGCHASPSETAQRVNRDPDGVLASICEAHGNAEEERLYAAAPSERTEGEREVTEAMVDAVIRSGYCAAHKAAMSERGSDLNRLIGETMTCRDCIRVALAAALRSPVATREARAYEFVLDGVRQVKLAEDCDENEVRHGIPLFAPTHAEGR